MRVFGITIFLSAFLLFLVQPLVAKAILPWYGSSPAVWTTCMLFFQTLLLAGYSYAHALVGLVSRRGQAAVHVVLLLAAVALLPITPHRPEPLVVGNPTWQILLVLTLSVGLPYTLLAASAPLLQSWFSACFAARSPYRLYALSNVGSLLALFSYPFLVEPLIPTGKQSALWSVGFGVLVLAAAMCAWTVWNRATPGRLNQIGEPGLDVTKSAPIPSRRAIGLWLAYATCGVVVLLAITNQMCQDLAVVPLLWVLPLSLYLLSFILCFESDRWYSRLLFLTLTIAGVLIICLVLMEAVLLSLWPHIALYGLVTFTACMCCHGELARLRPAPEWLTLFYLVVAIGGALGGVLVAIIAPLVFLHYWELDLGLAATCLLTWLAMLRENRDPRSTPMEPRTVLAGEPDRGRGSRAAKGKRAVSQVAAIPATPARHHAVAWIGIGVIVAESFLGWHMYTERAGVLRVERSFYGVLSVQLAGGRRKRDAQGHGTDKLDLSGLAIALFHGRVLHGMQYQAAEKRAVANLYYQAHTGIGRSIDSHPRRAEAGRPFRLGVVGLGTGTLAAYARAGDFARFYEINPGVIGLSESHGDGSGSGWFTFLSDARRRGATVEVALGDARLRLAQELPEGRRQRFDVLAVDAFSGDAIPIHLLTRECFDLYLQHLARGGVLAIHVSNHYLDLAPVVRRLAVERSLLPILVKAPPAAEYGNVGSTWVVVTGDPDFAQLAASWPEYLPWTSSLDRGPLWTDDFSSIFRVIRRR